MKNNYTSSTRTLRISRIHKIKHLTSWHATMLADDLNGFMSSEFSPLNSHDDFYDVEPQSSQLRQLLNFDSYHNFDYEFDQILSSTISNLFRSNKTYIEYALTTDDQGRIVGVSLIPFDAIKLITIRKVSLFLSKKHDGKFLLIKIPARRYVEINIKGIDVKRNYFKKLARKFKRMDKNRSTEFVLNEKMNKKFVFGLWARNEDFLTLKHPYIIGWYGRKPSNQLLSESYLLYRSIRFKLFRKTCLEYLLQRINYGLSIIGDEINTDGKIIINNPLPNFEKEWKRYADGEICASELSNIIYKVS